MAYLYSPWNEQKPVQEALEKAAKVFAPEGDVLFIKVCGRPHAPVRRLGPFSSSTDRSARRVSRRFRLRVFTALAICVAARALTFVTHTSSLRVDAPRGSLSLSLALPPSLSFSLSLSLSLSLWRCLRQLPIERVFERDIADRFKV